MRTNIICGAILIVVAGVFWTQRDYDNPQAAVFPDLVLVVLAILGVGILVHGILRGDRTRGPREINLKMLGIATALVVGWAFALGLVGFTISGVIAFLIMALLIRRGRPSVRDVVQDFIVAVAVVVGCFFIFTRVLLVPLPVSTLIGM